MANALDDDGILDLTGWSGPRAGVWRVEEPAVFRLAKAEDAFRFAAGLPHKLADRQQAAEAQVLP